MPVQAACRAFLAKRWLLLQTGYIDYDKLEEKALDFRPKLLICGGSAYPREWDYKRLSQIARTVGAYLLMDMAHIRYRPGCMLSFVVTGHPSSVQALDAACSLLAKAIRAGSALQAGLHGCHWETATRL